MSGTLFGKNGKNTSLSALLWLVVMMEDGDDVEMVWICYRYVMDRVR